MSSKNRGFVQLGVVILGVFLVGSFLLVKLYGYKTLKISSINMNPKVVNGQSWIVKSRFLKLSNKDVIAYEIPNTNYYEIARIIGLPGQTIMVREGKIFINDQSLEEPYIESQTTSDGKTLIEGSAKLIPANHYAVLADNRKNGLDSRDYGFIPKEDILGQLMFCYGNCGLKPTEQDLANVLIRGPEIFALANQYRSSLGIPIWNSSETACKIAEVRADFLSQNQGAAFDDNDEKFQSEFENHVKDYPDITIREIDAAGIRSNQGAIDLWKKSPDHHKYLTMTQDQGIPITQACVATRSNRTFNIAVLIMTSDKVKQSTVNPSAPVTQVGPGYTKQDIDRLVNDLTLADQDAINIQTFKGVSTYNQAVVERISQLIPQRKSLAQKLLDKMGKNQNLTEADFKTWDQYDALTVEQNELVKKLQNGNGGF